MDHTWLDVEVGVEVGAVRRRLLPVGEGAGCCRCLLVGHHRLPEVVGHCAAEKVVAVGHYLLGGVFVGGVEGVLKPWTLQSLLHSSAVL